MQITNILGREILDSRGNPTVEVDIEIEGSAFGRAAVPSGASTGSKEALELRDHDARYHGKGVMRAVENINETIAHKILNRSFESQIELDKFLISLDGTVNKSILGANAILAVSIAFAKAQANLLGREVFEILGESKKMPIPFVNVINGGAHADNMLDVQEFMIVPHGFENFKESIRAASEIFHTLKSLLKGGGFSTNVGDEGGFAPNFAHSEQAMDYIMMAIEKSGYQPKTQVSLALDSAASEFFEDGRYNLKGESAILSSEELVDYYQKLSANYPIMSLEDPMSEFDREGWKLITEVLGSNTQIVGDDIFVTNPALIVEGIEEGIANSVLIKVNQIGTLSETLEAIKIAHDAGYKTIISHRSGETEDAFISHLAVGMGSGQIKAGSTSRTDRLCKYNELIRIEELI